jgi:hypothetical protein
MVGMISCASSADFREVAIIQYRGKNITSVIRITTTV